MRIGIFTDAYAPLISGVVTSIVTLKEGLEALGHEVFIITTTAPKQHEIDDPQVIRLRGIIIPKKALKGFRYVLFSKRHVKKMMKLNLDVIHVHTEFSIGKLALKLHQKTNIPMVYTVHTSYQDYGHHISKFMAKFMPKISSKIAFNINNKFTKHANVTIAPTQKVLDKLVTLKHEGSFTVIPSGIDLNPFYHENHTQKDIVALKQKLNIQSDEFIAIVVARIAREKSLADLVDAFMPFHELFPKSKFFIVGDGPDKSELDKHIHKRKAQGFIKTLGFIKWAQVGLYYQVADCFLNASTTETQGLTYIEALAAGLPVFVRYDKVFDQFIEDGKNGVFFNKKEELTKLLIEVQNNKSLLDTLKSNARGSVQRFSKEVYATTVASLYQHILNKKSND